MKHVYRPSSNEGYYLNAADQSWHLQQEMVDWLTANVGQCRVDWDIQWEPGVNRPVVCFARESDLLIFALLEKEVGMMWHPV